VAPRWQVRIAVALGGLLMAGTGAAADSGRGVSTPHGFARFVTRSGSRLVDGDATVRFVSFNVPNLLVVEDAFRWGGDRPWRWPDSFELDDAFAAIAEIGGQVARSYVITVRRDDSDMGPFVHVTGPGEFNEEAFVAMDRMLAAANRAGVRVIVPLVDNWKWQGGAPQYAGFRGQPPEAFWTDPGVIADFKKTIEHVLLRRNTVTGVTYRDDRAILGLDSRVDPRDRPVHQAARSEPSRDRRQLAARRARGVARRTGRRRDHHPPLSGARP
jgi:hypothetical protein